MRALIPFFPLLLLIPVSTVRAQDDCAVRRVVEQDLPVADMAGVLIQAASGSLEVTGADNGFVHVRGVICAADEELARDARLIVEQRRDAAWIEAELPDTGWGSDYIRMDLAVEMPRALAADIRDSSGDIRVQGIAAVRIDDSSGGLEVRDVPGAVEIDDSSGGIHVAGAGSVSIADGSGEIEVADVRGAVHIREDGSGSIEIRRVGGDVRIDEDGSGSILVESVTGDLVVLDDGSGSITHHDIQGTVTLPDGGR